MKLTKAQIKQALKAYKRGSKAYTPDSPKSKHEALKGARREKWLQKQL